MELIQITEPNTEDEDIIVGIDLGTTNSLLAFYEESTPKIVELEEDKLLPSIVNFHPGGKITIGKSPLGFEYISIASIKRLMGKKFEKIDQSKINCEIIASQEGNCLLKIYDNYYEPAEISAKILEKLAQNAEEKLGKKIKNIVLTVPAYFDNSARNETKKAANLAGLNVVRLLNEPTSAALAYNLEDDKEGIYIVYDLGGGTFDISILKMQKGIFKVIATGGDADLGGDDIDQAIVEYLIEKYNISNQIARPEKHNLTRLAKEAKENPTDEKIILKTNLSGEIFEFVLERERIEEFSQNIVLKTVDIMKETIKISEIDLKEIEGIVLVGGSTRLVSVKEVLRANFAVKIFDEINPDEIVAIGAAIQAKNLSGNFGSLLLDVNPLSLGLEVMGGLNEKIIPRNSPIPVSVTEEFTTFADGQEGMEFHVTQGEGNLAKDCRSLAYFKIDNIPPKKAGEARIAVNFTLDADGILIVSCEGENELNKKSLEIRPSYQLNQEKVKEMLLKDSELGKQNI